MDEYDQEILNVLKEELEEIEELCEEAEKEKRKAYQEYLAGLKGNDPKILFKKYLVKSSECMKLVKICKQILSSIKQEEEYNDQ